MREQFAIDRKMKYYQFLKIKETMEEYEISNSEKTLSAGLGPGFIVNFVCPICFLVFYSLLFLTHISPLFVAQDINHYPSKPKILARAAQNFSNETEEIQTNLFWAFIPAKRKEKFKSKRKRLAKGK